MELRRAERRGNVVRVVGAAFNVVDVDTVVLDRCEIDGVLLDDVPDAAFVAQDVVFGGDVFVVVRIVAKVLRLFFFFLFFFESNEPFHLVRSFNVTLNGRLR